ncbi:Vps53-like, N-terminal, putative [Trypanosoma equiperdum]|uniref:Vps53-like, N-terminal, putative n=1 Tax=Trypanosoma equiperdum TaxID=5694 RepID=A0A1G4I0V7_TRYEQ|nr:Vps53-like, N-terminal, putative [Trypanosoma equiperdum]
MQSVRFSEVVERALAESFPSADTFDRPDFDPVNYINKAFPDAASLSELPAFVESSEARLRETECSLVRSVEAQAANAVTADKDLRNAKAAVAALYERVSDIKLKAAKSEDTVHELCHQIRQLDTAKTNLTAGINLLRSLQLWMLQLQTLSTAFERGKFIQCRDALAEVQKHSVTFSSLKNIPKVKQLFDKQAVLCEKLDYCIRYKVFGSLNVESLDEKQLSEASAVIDLLGNNSIRAIRESFISTMLESYTQRFQPGTESAQLERTERRYVYIRTLLEQNESLFRNAFPLRWCVPQELCLTFCLRTKADLDQLLSEASGNVDVVVLTYVLQKTIDVERDLTHMMAWKGDFPGKEALPQYRYNGIILSSFKDHMKLFVDNEDRLMGEALSQPILIEPEKSVKGGGGDNEGSTAKNEPVYGWGEESGSSVGLTIPLSADLFLFIRESLKRALRISQQDVLLDMAAVWRKYLLHFAESVGSLIPNPACTRQDVRHACIIANTMELCQSTSKGLGDEVCTRGEVPARVMGFEQVSETFSALYSKAIVSIVKGIEANMTPLIIQYGNERLSNNIEDHLDVHDESPHIRSMTASLHDMMEVCAVLLPQTNLRFLLDKLAATVVPLYTEIFYRSKCLLSGTAVGLMRVDSSALERTFVQLPNYNDPERFEPSKVSGYLKLVRREFDRFNRTLNVLQVDPTMDAFVDVYYEAMLPEDRSIQNFVRLVEMKGRRREDIPAWIAALSKRGVVEVTRRDGQREVARAATINTSEQPNSGKGSKIFGNLTNVVGRNAQRSASPNPPRTSAAKKTQLEKGFGERLAEAASSMKFLSNFKKDSNDNSAN